MATQSGQGEGQLTKDHRWYPKTVNVEDCNVQSVNKLRIVYSNVDLYSKDKMLEVSAKLKDIIDIPHVIALQEVKPYNFRYERISEEYKLYDYEFVECNLFSQQGRGMLMYIRRGFKYNAVEMGSNYCEHCCTEIVIGKSEKLPFASMYRSPTSELENSSELFNLFYEIIFRHYKYKV